MKKKSCDDWCRINYLNKKIKEIAPYHMSSKLYLRIYSRMHKVCVQVRHASLYGVETCVLNDLQRLQHIDSAMFGWIPDG